MLVIAFHFWILVLIGVLPTGCGIGRPTAGGNVSSLSGGETRRSAFVQGIEPGQTVRLADLEGPGIIRHFWFTAKSDDPRLYAGMVLRIWWDGEAEPSIETPLGDFFGVGFGEERPVRSAAIEMIPAGMPGHAALNCWLPMPFESARIEIENQSPEVMALFHIINWEKVNRLPADAGRLHAQWRRSNPVERGHHHTAVKARGKGRFAGLICSIRRLEPGAWVEGGDDFYVDISEDEWAALETWDPEKVRDPERRPAPDERSIANQPMGPVRPTLPGIGAEDYFGQSWGFREGEQWPYHGVSLGPEEEDPHGRLSAYRFHMADPIRFEKNLFMILRNHGWDVQARADDITTVAFWYQEEPHLGFPVLPPVQDRIPRVSGSED